MRGSDTVARLGGDEFIVLLETHTHPEHAGLVAEKLLARIAAPFPLAAGGVTVSASVRTASLWGMVTLAPTKPARGRMRRTSARCSGITGIGT